MQIPYFRFDVWNIILLLSITICSNSYAHVEHLLNIQLTPDNHSIVATDEVTFNNLSSKIFTLNNSLQIDQIEGATLHKIKEQTNQNFTTYQLIPIAEQVYIHYSGIIYDPIEQDKSNGLISSDGIALFGSSYWYPHIQNETLSFTLKVSLPHGWSSIAQGTKDQFANYEIWTERLPQQTIYLMANKFYQYTKQENGIVAQVYLLHADNKLAQQFISSTLQTIKLYSQMIGSYPYKKFAMVENFWETGFGMPSFTLLGPTVAHLPFIFYSSFPHEILHNWWGNSVYVNYNEGNWCEGLTTYLADHLMQERRGNGAHYRQDTLKKYTNFIQTGNDYPLRDFIYKEDNRSEVIGYNKGLMFFHMLKVQLGADLFTQGLQLFYRNNKFKTVSYPAIQHAFEQVSNLNLTTFFHQWVDIAGAPTIQLSNVSKHQQGISFTLTQTGEYLYNLLIPISVITTQGVTKTFKLTLNQTSKRYSLRQKNISQLKIDPNFDIFRRILPAEIASSLSLALGSNKPINIISSNTRYTPAIDELKQYFSPRKISFDPKLLDDHLNIILGNSSTIRQQLTAYTTPEFSIDSSVVIKDVPYPDKSVALILTAPHHPPILFLEAQAGMERRLIQKMIHYGKYSAVVFTGEQNILKTNWSVFNSPLFYNFTK